MTQPMSPNTGSRGASGSRSRTRINNAHLYELSPRNVQSKYMESNENPNTLNNAAWNEETEQKLHNFLQKRTNKRIKEINREFTEAKPAIFDRSNYEQQNNLLVEDDYIR